MTVNASPSQPVLEVRGLTRRFPGVLALNNVDFNVYAGEVHALVGENGAGKSTMINMLAGVLQPSNGSIVLNGKQRDFHSTHDSQHAGIGIIFQEFNLLPHLSVAENVFINREPTHGLRINWNEMNQRTQVVMDRLHIEINPRMIVSDLPVAQQQLVEIARALAFEAQVIVMDEPTAALSEREVDRLLEIVRSLKAQGVAVIYVSHKLNEVFAVADRITVLRDGQRIITEKAANLNEQKVIAAMVGRTLLHTECPVRTAGDLRLKVQDLCVEKGVQGVSFELHAGEVLGLAGLMGSGCDEVVEGLFGLRPVTVSELTLNGKPVSITGPRGAIHSRIGFVPPDRKQSGLLPDLSVKQNTSIGILERLRQVLWINQHDEQVVAENYRTKLNLRCSSLNQRISGLSGGNQQKVILARSLAEDCDVLFLAEPTRGVDVGAKAEIYALIDDLVQAGNAILLQSSELPEIIRLANRVIVFANGRPQGELSGKDLNQENIMALATRTIGESHE
jgi:ribose transport system ATP-binding protein